MVGLLGLAGEAGNQPPLHALDHRLRPRHPLVLRRRRPPALPARCPPAGTPPGTRCTTAETCGPTRNPEPEYETQLPGLRNTSRMVLPVQVERPHGGGIPRAGGGGEAEGPGGLRRAEGAPGPAAHGGLDSTALRRRWLMLLGVLAMSRRGFKGGGGAERGGRRRPGRSWGAGRGNSVVYSARGKPSRSQAHSRRRPSRSVCWAAPRESCWASWSGWPRMGLAGRTLVLPISRPPA